MSCYPCGDLGEQHVEHKVGTSSAGTQGSLGNSLGSKQSCVDKRFILERVTDGDCSLAILKTPWQKRVQVVFSVSRCLTMLLMFLSEVSVVYVYLVHVQ